MGACRSAPTWYRAGWSSASGRRPAGRWTWSSTVPTRRRCIRCARRRTAASPRGPGLGAGARYKFRLDGEDAFPDPAAARSRTACTGRRRWWFPTSAGRTRVEGRCRRGAVIYEVHVGTATPEGTFEALIARLAELAELGVTAVELMPLAEFPGQPQLGLRRRRPLRAGVVVRRAGGAPALRGRGARARARGAPRRGLQPPRAGGELPARRDAAAYFTDRHHTPWGDAIDYGDAGRCASSPPNAGLDPRLPRGRPAPGRHARHRGRLADATC